MRTTKPYRGYIGSIEYSPEDSLWYGKVLGIRSLLSYEGGMLEEAEHDFQETVDNYLDLCGQEKNPPEQPDKAQTTGTARTESASSGTDDRGESIVAIWMGRPYCLEFQDLENGYEAYYPTLPDCGFSTGTTLNEACQKQENKKEAWFREMATAGRDIPLPADTDYRAASADYAVTVQFSPVTCYLYASVPDLPGCCAKGGDRHELTANLDEAIDQWLRKAVENGDAIPRPRSISADISLKHFPLRKALRLDFFEKDKRKQPKTTE